MTCQIFGDLRRRLPKAGIGGYLQLSNPAASPPKPATLGENVPRLPRTDSVRRRRRRRWLASLDLDASVISFAPSSSSDMLGLPMPQAAVTAAAVPPLSMPRGEVDDRSFQSTDAFTH